VRKRSKVSGCSLLPRSLQLGHAVFFALGSVTLPHLHAEDYPPRASLRTTSLEPRALNSLWVRAAADRAVRGGVCVLLAVPLAAIVTTLVDVTVLGRDPRDQEAPTVLGRPKGAKT
jgi:ABC-type branched-subunit amino acid transport system permease subunit